MTRMQVLFISHSDLMAKETLKTSRQRGVWATFYSLAESKLP